MNIPRIVYVFLFICALHGASAAQRKDKVEVFSKVSAEVAGKECKDLTLGRAVNFPKPAYPAEAKNARAGGTILIKAKINEKGVVSEVEEIAASRFFQNTAADAARKAKFSVTTCDGAPTPALAVLTYNFIPYISADRYYTPTKTEEFTDLRNDSPYYEAVLNLTENYKFAFGYADKRFYADAPLTRGDFAQYLRLTLDLLSERAAAANKFPREINLFFPYNSQKLLSANNIKDLKPNAPFYESVKTLLLKYDIALSDEKNEFQGSRYLTNNEILDWWSKIFGEEAIPVNFERDANGERIISRGEFALFLQESLQVLTYKVLP